MATKVTGAILGFISGVIISVTGCITKEIGMLSVILGGPFLGAILGAASITIFEPYSDRWLMTKIIFMFIGAISGVLSLFAMYAFFVAIMVGVAWLLDNPVTAPGMKYFPQTILGSIAAALTPVIVGFSYWLCGYLLDLIWGEDGKDLQIFGAMGAMMGGAVLVPFGIVIYIIALAVGGLSTGIAGAIFGGISGGIYGVVVGIVVKVEINL